MKVNDIGGEFELIKRLTDNKIKDSAVVKGIGDDCAVLKYAKGDTKNKYLLVTTDMLVENDHFRTDWQSAFQIGMKLMEANVSDIVAMGGIPKYAFVSMSIKKSTTVEFMDELYRGLYASAKKHNVLIIGGDTTHGTECVFNLTLLGEVDKSLLRLRSMAKKGDVICVTGALGGSAAGLNLLMKGKQGFLRDYLEPKSRTFVEAKIIARYSNAMIDVSDGLGSEVKHICEESNVGARIDFENIPLSKTTTESAKTLEMSAHDFALYGGEDFELVFTLSQKNVERLRTEFSDFTVVGRIEDKKKGVFIQKGNQQINVGKGFDHFSAIN